MSNGNGWTPERRERQAERIRLWQPWKTATGPKTEAGKRRSSMNNLRHGLRSASVRRLYKALAGQRRLLRQLQAKMR